MADQDLLVLLDISEGPDLVSLEVSHHPAVHSVGKAGVIDERDIGEETSLGVISIQIWIRTDVDPVANHDPQDLGHLLGKSFL